MVSGVTGYQLVRFSTRRCVLWDVKTCHTHCKLYTSTLSHHHNITSPPQRHTFTQLKTSPTTWPTCRWQLSPAVSQTHSDECPCCRSTTVYWTCCGGGAKGLSGRTSVQNNSFMHKGATHKHIWWHATASNVQGRTPLRHRKETADLTV